MGRGSFAKGIARYSTLTLDGNVLAQVKKGSLSFFCGKMGAGKSTLARQLAADEGAVLLSEDDWLAALYPNQIFTLADYVECSARLKAPVKTLVQSMLLAGTDVVMDFPANTTAQRAWLREVFSEVGAEHCLVYIDLADAVCLKRIEQRRLTEPGRASTDTPEMFAQVTRYFEAPSPAEGFTLKVYE